MVRDVLFICCMDAACDVLCLFCVTVHRATPRLWWNLIRKSGIAEEQYATFCTLPLDLTSESGFATGCQFECCKIIKLHCFCLETCVSGLSSRNTHIPVCCVSTRSFSRAFFKHACFSCSKHLLKSAVLSQNVFHYVVLSRTRVSVRYVFTETFSSTLCCRKHVFHYTLLLQTRVPLHCVVANTCSITLCSRKHVFQCPVLSQTRSWSTRIFSYYLDDPYYVHSHICKKRLLASSSSSVSNNLAPTGRILITFDIWWYFENM